MKIVTMTAAAALLTAGTAFAGGVNPAPSEPMVMAPAAPMVMPSQDWTGGYAGLSLGYGDGSSETSGGGDFDADGYGVGAFAGYNYDFGTLVMGGEVEIGTGNVNDDNGNLDVDSGVRLKLKAGADLGQTMVYGLAGGTYASAEVNNNDVDAAGYLVGAGVEYRITPNVGLGAEVIYEDFGDIDGGTGTEADVTSLNLRALYAF
ncbi:hypothetical protein PARPLA_02393 [Rhodobacteraceae bacterium THAF1]|uniref:outer membrane protein n=1 Tax=Palleronia sp. THAF1 TaxID=2587842 RepID=UPI000F3F0862|nr:outer membrane beta-barrel protein [Palleronia sp. THAF1]QFU09203.1 hypothetical protein FIU81_11015 [Palleronia sp. THAF1]VDC27316.1 hypothetical protein PARPLA_02393 [Rhodobacteraceae bacterium THAF1]